MINNYLDSHWKYYIVRPHIFVRDLFLNTKAFLQRGSRGWADCDVWAIDEYLAGILPEMLTRLSEISTSHPSEFKSPEQWKKKLLQIAHGLKAFERYHEDGDLYMDFVEEYQKALAEQQKALKALSKYFNSLWD